eukprot:Tbor_TRINITY_DN4238_c1_g1::TRINITY_DN4238_c1_g1_i1::g.23848::m.23848
MGHSDINGPPSAPLSSDVPLSVLQRAQQQRCHQDTLKKNRSISYASVIVLLVGIFVLGLLCFWSMSTPAFHAGNSINGTWEAVVPYGEEHSDGISDGEIVIDVSSQMAIDPSTEQLYILNANEATFASSITVKSANDDSKEITINDQLSDNFIRFGTYKIKDPILYFKSISNKPQMWSWVGECEGAVFCSMVLQHSGIILSVVTEDSPPTEGRASSEGPTKQKAKSIFFVRTGKKNVILDVGRQKIRYLVAIVVIVVLLKYLLTKLEPESSRQQHRRLRQQMHRFR